MSQTLKEAVNNVTIEGILNENKLELKKLQDGREFIAGDLIVAVSQTNTIPVNFFSFKMKKDGGPNKIYNSLQTIMNTYKSVAQHGVEGADKVRITGGRLEANDFYNAAGQLISTFRIRSNFVNRVTADFSPDSAFQIETFIQGMTEEAVQEELTGRLMIKGVVPMYGGRISLLTFYVEDEKGIKYIEDNYNTGDTVKLAGFIRNSVEKIEKTEEMEFGEDIVNTFQKTRKEIIVNKGSRPYEEGGFDPALIKQAMAERETELKAAKEKATTQTVTSGKGGGFGGSNLPF